MFAYRPIIETTTKHHFRSSFSLSPIICSLTLQTSGSSTLKSLLFSNLYANTCTTFFNSSIQNSYLKTVFFLKSDSFFLTSVFQTHYFKPNLTLSKKNLAFSREKTLCKPVFPYCNIFCLSIFVFLVYTFEKRHTLLSTPYIFLPSLSLVS